jgi:hypothetical protein
LAAVNIDSIPIGIDFEIVDGQVVDPSCQNAEVAALQDREIAQQDVVAVFERDGLIPYPRSFCARLLRASTAQAFAPDQTRPKDGDIVDPLAPNQTIVPVVVATRFSLHGTCL